MVLGSRRTPWPVRLGTAGCAAGLGRFAGGCWPDGGCWPVLGCVTCGVRRVGAFAMAWVVVAWPTPDLDGPAGRVASASDAGAESLAAAGAADSVSVGAGAPASGCACFCFGPAGDSGAVTCDDPDFGEPGWDGVAGRCP